MEIVCMIKKKKDKKYEKKFKKDKKYEKNLKKTKKLRPKGT